MSNNEIKKIKNNKISIKQIKISFEEKEWEKIFLIEWKK
jgi:hypothetical protein